jgi:hypothetical protein
MKARVIVTYDCNRKCVGCCNKNWKYEPPRIVTSFTRFSEVILTGGEPLLFPEELLSLVDQVRGDNSKAKVYVYTAATESLNSIAWVLHWVDGICLTLHKEEDVKKFDQFMKETSFPFWESDAPPNKSLRLNIFKGIGFPVDTSKWIVKKDIEWLKDCPLPKDEILYKLPTLWTKERN